MTRKKIVTVTDIVLKEDCVKSYHMVSHRKSSVRIHEWAFNKYRFRVINLLTMPLPSIIEKDIYIYENQNVFFLKSINVYIKFE